jgi:hypothetical protein
VCRKALHGAKVLSSSKVTPRNAFRSSTLKPEPPRPQDELPGRRVPGRHPQ